MSEPVPTVPRGLLGGLVAFFVESKVVVFLLLVMLGLGGVVFAPFAFETLDDDWGLERDPIPVDAIPDIGENQQIVFAAWPGHSPADVEDQVAYPLTSALLGLQGVRTVRSTSMLGFTSLYVIFDEEIEFYDSRARLLEKLSSLPPGLLPTEVAPTLGPDATALGQVFWYTLEGHAVPERADPGHGVDETGAAGAAVDEDATPVAAWDLFELRELQDFTVRPALQSVPGVAEVASVGGHVAELQVEADPAQLRAYGLSFGQLIDAVRASNLDVGARTFEINAVEYIVRGLGQIEDLDDLRGAVVATHQGRAVLVSDVAHVTLGPAPRRGVLDDAGAEVVGGVVVVRYGENPREVIARVRTAVAELAPSLPSRTLEDGRRAQVRIVPFYDRTGLIDETLGTLSSALWQQLLVTLLVVLVMLGTIRGSIVVALVPPLGVLFSFIAMRIFGVEANVMALAGIAIAIGTMVDVGIVLAENIAASLRDHDDGAAADDRTARASRAAVVIRATQEVAPAVATSVLTTIVSFLPVFALTAAEGKLFRPLAFTKTFALVGAFVVGVLVVPAVSHLLSQRRKSQSPAKAAATQRWNRVLLFATAALLVLVLAAEWHPFGEDAGSVANIAFVLVVVGGLLGGFLLFQHVYPRLLAGTLRRPLAFLLLPLLAMAFGVVCWRGTPWPSERFAGLRPADVPAFDEGSFLYMPTTTPHASIGECRRLLQQLDAAIAAIPEVDRVVGKLGRADSVLDPAPISMIETLVTYRPEYEERVVTPGEAPERVRVWRDHIRTPADIWDEIVAAGRIPGLTSAPLLQPIQTRLVMLQTGMRSRVGIKVRGPDVESLAAAGRALEAALAGVEAVAEGSVYAERVVGKPYLEVEPDREALARYGLQMAVVQQTLAAAVGGAEAGVMIDGRVRRTIRVRAPRDARLTPEAIEALPVVIPGRMADAPAAMPGTTAASLGDALASTVPLGELAQVLYVRGPQMLRSEDTFLTSFVLFEPADGVTDVDAVRATEAHLAQLRADGELTVPDGVTWRFAGTYENQIRSSARLMWLLPIALMLILLLLYLQFRSLAVTFSIFASVGVAMSGGFMALWAWGRPWLDVSMAGHAAVDLFGAGTVPLTVAVWVGFIALIGIAVDDGVVMATYLKQRFEKAPRSMDEVRAWVLEAGERRIRPCLMTTATTILALLPVLTATGRGSDVMRPMALPLVGGMALELMTLFVVPVLWALGYQARFAYEAFRVERTVLVEAPGESGGGAE